MDDDLRPAIDRLVKDGGRLTVDAPGGGTTVVLEQPGSRFGILEVSARVALASADARAAADLAAMGWSDPTVTYRLGREIRLPRADSSPDGPTIVTRTWRVPPALAAEVAEAVRAVLGDVGRVDYQPLVTRDPRVIESVRTPWQPTEEHDLDHSDERRTVARTVPAPLKGPLAITVIGAVAVVWAGMISGAPRLPTPATRASATALAGGVPASAAPTPTPASTRSADVAIRSDGVRASTEEDAGPASAAVDGEVATAWHAAFGVPQWIEIGLDAPSTVREVVLLIAQAENGPSRHMIQVAVTGRAFQVVGVVDRRTSDGDAIVFRPDIPIANVERIRIETMASPSNAGWYEVIVR